MTKNNGQMGGRRLVTMDEIEQYTGRNRKVIKQWVKEQNFPAAKIDGRWESHTDLIDIHCKRRIEELTGCTVS